MIGTMNLMKETDKEPVFGDTMYVAKCDQCGHIEKSSSLKYLFEETLFKPCSLCEFKKVQ